jgi:uncharacterized protein
MSAGDPPAQAATDIDIGIQERDGGVSFRVRVQPRSSRDGVEGPRDGALVVRLTAPPVEGEANAALARVLGRALGVAPGRVRLRSGAASRRKRVHVSGLTAAALEGWLGGRIRTP